MPDSILRAGRFLVIDDEVANTRLLQMMLEMAGARHVTTVVDPRSAEVMFMQGDPDIVLLDLHMPHLSGFDLLKRFRELRGEEERPAILVLTADITMETRRRALVAGADDFVTKPLDHTEVMVRTRNLLQKRFLERELREQNDMLDQMVKARTRELETALERLKGAQAQMVKQERLRALGMMASGIAHDFNNALTLILGHGELIAPHLRRSESEREAGYLEQLMIAAKDATHVVRRLREFYRPAENRDEFEPLSIGDLVVQVVEMTRPRWGERSGAPGIRVRLDLAETRVVMGHPAELREALMNLIFNAVDAMPVGGEIVVETRQLGDETAVMVSDTGVGMTEEERVHCLEPFFTTKGENGTGLGLAVVYGTVERHGGRIAVSSTKGVGTTFTLSLPSVGASDPAKESMPSVVPKRLRILVVDDQEIIAGLMEELLRVDGHDVRAVFSGAQALDTLKGFEADVVLTDESMPEMTGLELLGRLRAGGFRGPVVLMTGFGSDAVERAGSVEVRPDAVLGKPVTLEALRVALMGISVR
jgi:signal transduction histidine kinase